MNKRDTSTLLLGGVGVGDSVYLLLNSLFPSVTLKCPTSGVINCAAVTSSPYSHVFGIPVALFGLSWFVAVMYLAFARPSFFPYLLFPLWAAGIAMVGYLVSVEALEIHAICLYCTLAHICAIMLGPTVYRITFTE